MSEGNLQLSELEVAKTAKTSLLAVRQQLNENDTYEEAEGTSIVTDLDNTNATAITLEEAFPLEVETGHNLEGYWDATNYDTLTFSWTPLRTNSVDDTDFFLADGQAQPPIFTNPEINNKGSLGFNEETGLQQEPNSISGGRYLSYVAMLVQFQSWTAGLNILFNHGAAASMLQQAGTSPAIDLFDGTVSNLDLTLRSLPYDKSWYIIEIFIDRSVGSYPTLVVTNLKTGETSSQQNTDTVETFPEFTGMIIGAGFDPTATALSAQFQLGAVVQYSAIDPETSSTFPEEQRDIIKAYLTQQFGGIALPLTYTDEQNGTANDNPEEILD